MVGMACLAALCSLVFFSGLSSLPLQQLEIDYYIKKRIVDSSMPIRQLAARLSQPEMPYRAELASTMSLRVAAPEDAAAIPALAALLEDGDPRIRYSAASALSGVFHAMPVPPTEADLDPQTCARIIRGLDDPDPTFRSAAMILTRGRPPAVRNFPAEIVAGEVKRFVAMLDDADPDRRRQAVNALRTMGPRARAAAPALERRIREGDIAERLWAAIALSHVDPTSKAAIEFMAESLVAPQQPPQLRMQAAQRLGDLGPAARASVPKFLEAWEKRFITIEAAAMLHRIDSEAAARAGIPQR
jgi:HEAT repeat protein